MPPSFARTVGRLRRLASLDDSVYDELRFESAATVPAVAVTVVGLLTFGFGGWLWWWLSDLGETGSVLVKSVVLGTVFGFGAWLGWMLIVYAVLRRLAGLAVPIEQLLRTAGFASGVLIGGLAMAIVPIGFGVGVIVLVAWFAATQVAIERTVDRGGSVVVAANLAGFAAWLLVMSLVSTGTNQIGPGPFLAEAVWDAITGSSVTFG
ncbi:MAG: hypothetical protein AB7F65_03920 [Dehalococcoidia bacterium]